MKAGIYKEILICLVVIVLIVTLNIWTENYTNESIIKMSDKLETLKQAMNEEKQDNENIKNQINSILDEWNNRYQKLAYYIEHDELEKVNTELVSLKANIEVEEYKQGNPDLDKCIFILNHIKEKSSMQIKNIF